MVDPPCEEHRNPQMRHIKSRQAANCLFIGYRAAKKCETVEDLLDPSEGILNNVAKDYQDLERRAF